MILKWDGVNMQEIRLHGRGGQGAVTSAELLAIAAINLGKYAQAFPSFGPERRGAPVVAFIRVSDKPIRLRCNITEPDVVLVLDHSILKIVPVTSGLKPNGMLIANTAQPVEAIRENLGYDGPLALVDAQKIAFEELGLPITNTTMLGALLKATGIMEPEALVEPIQERFGRVAQKNLNALKRAYEETIVYK